MACKNVPTTRIVAMLLDKPSTDKVSIISSRLTGSVSNLQTPIFAGKTDLSNALAKTLHRQMIESGVGTDLFGLARATAVRNRRNNPTLYNDNIDITDERFLSDSAINQIAKETNEIIAAIRTSDRFRIRDVFVDVRDSSGQLAKQRRVIWAPKQRAYFNEINMLNKEFKTLTRKRLYDKTLSVDPVVFDDKGIAPNGQHLFLNQKSELNTAQRTNEISEKLVRVANAMNETQLLIDQQFINSLQELIDLPPSNGLVRSLSINDAISENTKLTIKHSIQRGISYAKYVGDKPVRGTVGADAVLRLHSCGWASISP